MNDIVKIEGDLNALRAGLIGFEVVAQKARPMLSGYAEKVLWRYVKWGQRHIDREDIVQDMLIEMWRAVDEWDSERGTPLLKFVNYRIGAIASRSIIKACGNPRKDRVGNPGVPVHGVDMENMSHDATIDALVDAHMRAQKFAASSTSALAPRIVADIARDLYDDPTFRRDYRWANYRDAVSDINRARMQFNEGAI